MELAEELLAFSRQVLTPTISGPDQKPHQSLSDQDALSPPLKGAGQAGLRRAISGCYHAVFHAVVSRIADTLAQPGDIAGKRGTWTDVQPGLQHAQVAQALNAAAKDDASVRKLAAGCADLKLARESADYSHDFAPEMLAALRLIEEAEALLQEIHSLSDASVRLITIRLHFRNRAP